MEFDKSRVYTALNADELKVGSKVIVADDLETLKRYVRDNENLTTLKHIRKEFHMARFKVYNDVYALCYLVEEPEEEKLKWDSLKIGDVITNGELAVMVTGIDKKDSTEFHIYAGSYWIPDTYLKEYVKVEE